MALDATIVEVPKPPAGRLPFLRLLARLVSNPVASWGEDFYDEPIVVYRDFGLETVFVTDPVLTQQILLDDSDAFTKSPLYDNVLGRAGGRGCSSPKATTGAGKGVSPHRCSVPRRSSLMRLPLPLLASQCWPAGAKRNPARFKSSAKT